ncbi:alpha/beta fold hydrolase [Corynebacterium mayonis]|uniref:alpha/beta fold hydrolase n=1 Tax=Corynebacterium mayonis TaxID=3062461 RepID=UPI0031405B27
MLESVIDLPDGSQSTVLVFRALVDAPSTKPLVVIWPGFGMGARYFKPIASWLSEQGFPAVIGELRGQGSSTAVASRAQQWGYHSMATEDYPLTISAAKKALGLEPSHPVVFLAHSMGGQIGILYLTTADVEANNVRGMMGVGAGSPYWRGFDGAQRLKIRTGVTFMGAFSRVFGYWPGGRFDIAGYGRQSGWHLGEWARFSRTNSLDHVRGDDYATRLQAVSTPILLTRFNNDEDCPIASAQNLAQHVPAAHPVVEELKGDLGHNRWAREPEITGRRLIAFCEGI